MDTYKPTRRKMLLSSLVGLLGAAAYPVLAQGKLNTPRILPTGSSEPADLVGTVNPQYVANNNLENPSLVDGSANAYTVQEIYSTGGWIEARLSTQGSDFVQFGLLQPEHASQWGFQLPNQIYRTTLDFSPTGVPGIRISERAAGASGDAVVKYLSGSLGSVTAVTIRIMVIGTQVRYYSNYAGGGTIPFYVSNIPAPLPLVGIVAAVNSTASVSEVQNVTVGHLWS